MLSVVVAVVVVTKNCLPSLFLDVQSLIVDDVINKPFIVSDMDNPTLDVIHEKYLTCLRTFAKKHFPNQPNRVEELLVRLPEVLNYSATF